MCLEGVLFVRRTIAQMRVYQDKRWLFLVSLRSFDRALDRHQVIAIFNGLSVPSVGTEAFFDVFGKSEIGGCR